MLIEYRKDKLGGSVPRTFGSLQQMMLTTRMMCSQLSIRRRQRSILHQCIAADPDPSINLHGFPVLSLLRYHSTTIQSPLQRSRVSARVTSSPSPLDQIPYLVFKKCPSLTTALMYLFNLCWQQGNVPRGWKQGVIHLIPKATAREDPISPS